MRKVIIISPETDLEYAKLAVKHSLHQKEAPISGTLLYGTAPEGPAAIASWSLQANFVAVYADKGITKLMQSQISWHRSFHKHLDYRHISPKD